MDTQEYERLAEKYLDCIYRVAVNGCNTIADAEDVVQNTFVTLTMLINKGSIGVESLRIFSGKRTHDEKSKRFAAFYIYVTDVMWL